MGHHRAGLQGSLGYSLVFQTLHSNQHHPVYFMYSLPVYSSSLPDQLSTYWVPLLDTVLIPVCRENNLWRCLKQECPGPSALNVDLCLFAAEDPSGHH